MAEYLAPGVYVEETSFRAKSIEGVSTTTTGLVGPCRYGPLDLENELVTSLSDFELTYGDGRQLKFGTDSQHNYLWHAVRAFFAEGGKRLYVSRIYSRTDGDGRASDYDEDGTPVGGAYPDGYARYIYPKEKAAAGDEALLLRARYPGQYGNLRVRLTPRLGQSVLRPDPADASQTQVAGALRHRDVVLVVRRPGGSGTDRTGFYLAERSDDSQPWTFTPTGAAAIGASDLAGHDLRVVTLTVVVMVVSDSRQAPLIWDGLALDHEHTTNGAYDALTRRFGLDEANPNATRGMPVVIQAGSKVAAGVPLLELLAPRDGTVWRALLDPTSKEDARSVDVTLAGGSDGARPAAAHYEGAVDASSMRKTGLAQFEDIDDISIVAAPGSTFGYSSYADARTIVGLLIEHAQKMRYRIAVLDSGDRQSLSEVRAMRATLDSSWAALYYPWVRVLDPITRAPIFLPPSGFVAGIYARNDTNRAVYKAPANEVVNLSIGFEILLNKAQQDVLNPEGINAFRYFEGRGYRLWGARTASSDPEWKYVNLRRYFAYLERSIDKGTQWAVFEPNGEQLWGNVRRTIEDFLLNEWQSGALLGDKPEKAYFVRCDRSTMTQNDLDNGRLVCLIGVAPVRPAEFVIFRIGQWTAERKS